MNITSHLRRVESAEKDAINDPENLDVDSDDDDNDVGTLNSAISFQDQSANSKNQSANSKNCSFADLGGVTFCNFRKSQLRGADCKCSN